MSGDDSAFPGIAETAARVQRREVSPVELTQLYLGRIEKHNGRLNAYTTVLGDVALAAARAAEREIGQGLYRGPLHGIPIALKDLFDVQGVRRACGSRILAEQIAESNADAVERLDMAGAILLGKTHMHEFAFGGTSINPHYGTPRNPWNETRIPGGSSGGSAVAVGAALAMGALGTDTGGSVRIPASLCGIVGLKPTYGRVSRRGVYPLSYSLDHVGPLARDVRDAAFLLQVLAGQDPRDPTSSLAPVPDYGAALTEDIRGLRIGVPREYFFEDTQPVVRSAVAVAALHFTRLGAVVDEVSMPAMRHVPGSSTAIIAAEAYEIHADTLRARADEYGADVRQRLLLGACIQASQYLKAQRFRTLLRRETLRVLAGVDLLLTPTTPIVATRIDQPRVDVGNDTRVVAAHIARATRPFNMTGLPAISLPCGFTAEGLPIGLQIAGRPFEETTVLRAAYAYEQSTAWHTRRPAALDPSERA